MAIAGQANVFIVAPARLIWDLISDVTRMGEWSPETTGAQWVGPADRATVGARFEGHNARRSRWTTTAEVTAASPGEAFAFRTLSKRPTTWRFELDPIEGGTMVIERFHAPRYGWPDRLAFLLTTGVRDRQTDLVRNCQQTLRRLKAAAEHAARHEGTPE